MGVYPGFADLFIMLGIFEHTKNIDEITPYEFYAQLRIYHGLFIELKVGKNQQTPAQKEFERKAIEACYQYIVCRSFDEFKAVIENYMKP